MFCPQCGTEIDAFPCPVCGRPSPETPRARPVEFAGWWLRVSATVIDNLILVVPSLAAYLLGDAIANAAVGTLFSLAVYAVYLILMLARPSGQTVGNLISGTRVRDAVTGQAITLQQATRRWVLFGLYNAMEYAGAGNALATTLLFVVVIADVFYPLMNPMKQTWHDRFAGTVVVRG